MVQGEAAGLWELIERNRRQSAALVFIMGILLVGVGLVIGFAIVPVPAAALIGGAITFCLWLVLTLLAFYAGDKAVLSIAGAKPVTHKEFPVLCNVVDEMAIAGGLPRPKVYVIDDSAPNAFATGKNHQTAALAVTTGLLERLNRDELQGVIAHEMSHIRHQDVRYMTLIVIMFGTIVLLCDMFRRLAWYSGGFGNSNRRSSRRGGGGHVVILLIALVLAVIAPILARLLYLAVSRRREYLADAGACELSRYPEGLASALEKIANYTGSQLHGANRAMAHMYIANPLKVREKRYSRFNSTHPPIDERVKILRSVAGGSPSLSSYQLAFRNVTGARKPLMSSKADQIGDTRTFEKRIEKEESGTPATASVGPASAGYGLRGSIFESRLRPAPGDTSRTEDERKKQFLGMATAAALLTCTRCGKQNDVPKDNTEKFIKCAACGQLMQAPGTDLMTAIAAGAMFGQGGPAPSSGHQAPAGTRVSIDSILGKNAAEQPAQPVQQRGTDPAAPEDGEKQALKERLNKNFDAKELGDAGSPEAVSRTTSFDTGVENSEPDTKETGPSRMVSFETDADGNTGERTGQNDFGVTRMPDGTLIYPPQITCPECSKAIDIPAGFKGSAVVCPHCNQRFRTI